MMIITKVSPVSGQTLTRDLPITREQYRADFCHWMAETIREYLETGKGPWEER